jgi:uncharacterized membrane protein YtjA (UPF0391 family)
MPRLGRFSCGTCIAPKSNKAPIISRRGPESRIYNAEAQMFSWAVVFFIIAIVAGLFGFVGIAGTATHIAWVLFVIGLILAIVFMVLGRRPPPV